MYTYWVTWQSTWFIYMYMIINITFFFIFLPRCFQKAFFEKKDGTDQNLQTKTAAVVQLYMCSPLWYYGLPRGLIFPHVFAYRINKSLILTAHLFFSHNISYDFWKQKQDWSINSEAKIFTTITTWKYIDSHGKQSGSYCISQKVSALAFFQR